MLVPVLSLFRHLLEWLWHFIITLTCLSDVLSKIKKKHLNNNIEMLLLISVEYSFQYVEILFLNKTYTSNYEGIGETRLPSYNCPVKK